MNWFHMSIALTALCVGSSPSQAEDLSLDCEMKGVKGVEETLKINIAIKGDAVTVTPIGLSVAPTEFQNEGKTFVKISDSEISFGSDKEGISIDRNSGDFAVRRPPASALVADSGHCEKTPTTGRKF